MGEFACFALKPSKAGDKLDRADFRKGMILIDPAMKPEPVLEFEVLENSKLGKHSCTSSSNNYEPWILGCYALRCH